MAWGVGFVRGAAWGLSSPGSPETWERRALCRLPGADPALWDGGSACSNRQAAHVCIAHCPVRVECEADAVRRGGSMGVVVGGVLWNKAQPKPSGHQPQSVSCGQFCRFARQPVVVGVGRG